MEEEEGEGKERKREKQGNINVLETNQLVACHFLPDQGCELNLQPRYRPSIRNRSRAQIFSLRFDSGTAEPNRPGQEFSKKQTNSRKTNTNKNDTSL